jgi:beta-glucanase (GH16 family)
VHARDQAFEYGTVEVTAQTIGASGQGWPAIWLLGNYCQHPQFLVAGNDPSSCSWPDVGSEEIDLEDWYGGSLSNTSANLFDAPTGSTGTNCHPGSPLISPSADLAFHTYKMIWTPTSIVIQVDNVTFCTFSSQLPTSVMFPILSAQMSGNVSLPSPATQYFDNISITPAGPDIASSANWPSITGSTTHGSALTADHGTWTGSPTAYHYQWLQCSSAGADCSPITNGTCSSTFMACGSTYTPTPGDVGHTIQVLVEADNSSGKTQYGSNVTGAIS